MKKVLISLTLLTLLSEASLLDFSYLIDAKEAYSKKDYAKADELYSKVDSDEARFNQANALYRQKKYKEALSAYQSISNKQLEFDKLHNIGNCYANLKKTDEAIKSYEDALKIKEDKDSRFNLEFLKKKKKEQQKKDKKDDKKKQDDKKQDDKKKQDQKNNKDSKENKSDKDKKSQEDKKKNQEQKDKEKKEQENKKKSEEEKKREAEKKKKEEEQQKEAQMAKQGKKQPPITDMEERKWQKMLNQKGVNTLMLPLNNKEHKKDETNPW